MSRPDTGRLVPVPPLEPAQAFADESPSADRALAVVALVALVSALALVPVGWALAHSFAPGTTVENPDRPPERLCENREPMTVDGRTVDFSTPEGCSESARVSVRSVVWRVVGQQAVVQFLSTLVSWGLVAGAVYALARAEVDGRDAIVVTGWGTVPWAAGAVVTAGLLVLTLGTVDTAAAGSVRAVVDAFTAGVRASRPVALAVQAGVAAWTGWIHYHGLRVRTALSGRRSFELAAVVNASAYLLVAASTLVG